MTTLIRSALFAIAMMVLCPAGALAQEAPPSETFFTQETLTGDWFGARKKLEQDGVQLGGDEIFDIMANLSGGEKQGGAFEGRFEIFANLDLGILAGWKGLVHVNAYVIHGKGLSSDDVG